MPPATKVFVLSTVRTSLSEAATPEFRLHGVYANREKAMKAAPAAARAVLAEKASFPPSERELTDGYWVSADFWTVIATVREFDLSA